MQFKENELSERLLGIATSGQMKYYRNTCIGNTRTGDSIIEFGMGEFSFRGWAQVSGPEIELFINTPGYHEVNYLLWRNNTGIGYSVGTLLEHEYYTHRELTRFILGETPVCPVVEWPECLKELDKLLNDSKRYTMYQVATAWASS